MGEFMPFFRETVPYAYGFFADNLPVDDSVILHVGKALGKHSGINACYSFLNRRKGVRTGMYGVEDEKRPFARDEFDQLGDFAFFGHGRLICPEYTSGPTVCKGRFLGRCGYVRFLERTLSI